MRWIPIVLLLTWPGQAQKFYPDDPVLQEPPPRDAGKLAARKLSDIYDLFRNTLAPPGELQSKSPVRIPARGVNTLGNPMDENWWTPRHYFKRMSRQELKQAPDGRFPPSRNGKWKVVRAKSEGVTPGFTIVDSEERTYFVKFDSVEYPELSTAADQISGKIFHALGYLVPDNYLVFFTPDQLELSKEVQITDGEGLKRPMLPADLTALLRRAAKTKDGRIRATASLAVQGSPIGPYRYNGTRADDPNDIVPHEHRRDLRGMRLAAAWVDHDDSRAINTYDSLVEVNGKSFVRHYQLDFGSTLGSGSYKPNSPRSGGEYLFDWKTAALNFFTLGAVIPQWALAKYPDIPSIGRFESKRFSAADWVPEYPNPAFSNALPDDDFWMAKQIMSFTDDDIAAIVETAQFSDPGASAYMAACLSERRDKIGRYAFGRMLPLDHFSVRDGRLVWEDLSAVHGFGGAGPVQVQWSRYDNNLDRRDPLSNGNSPSLPSPLTDGYWVADLVQSQTPSHQVSVYFRATSGTPKIVGVEYKW